MSGLQGLAVYLADSWKVLSAKGSLCAWLGWAEWLGFRQCFECLSDDPYDQPAWSWATSPSCLRIARTLSWSAGVSFVKFWRVWDPTWRLLPSQNQFYILMLTRSCRWGCWQSFDTVKNSRRRLIFYYAFCLCHHLPLYCWWGLSWRHINCKSWRESSWPKLSHRWSHPHLRVNPIHCIAFGSAL